MDCIREYEHFNKLNNINVNEHTEKKNNLTYLSWAWAWAELKKVYPDATYKVKQFDGKPYLFDERLGYMVSTEMTVDGITHEMWLPVMDGANKAMKDKPYVVQTKFKETTIQPATMFDINTALMRCLTKNISMFGLGLYIYAGEDLPEAEQQPQQQPLIACVDCGAVLTDRTIKGKIYTPQDIAAITTKKYGRVLCENCSKKEKENNNA